MITSGSVSTFQKFWTPSPSCLHSAFYKYTCIQKMKQHVHVCVWLCIRIAWALCIDLHIYSVLCSIFSIILWNNYLTCSFISVRYLSNSSWHCLNANLTSSKALSGAGLFSGLLAMGLFRGVPTTDIISSVWPWEETIQQIKETNQNSSEKIISSQSFKREAY